MSAAVNRRLPRPVNASPRLLVAINGTKKGGRLSGLERIAYARRKARGAGGCHWNSRKYAACIRPGHLICARSTTFRMESLREATFLGH